MIEFCFASILHVDVVEVMSRKSWRWFALRVRGFLRTPTSPLAQYFRSAHTDEPGTDEDA